MGTVSQLQCPENMTRSFVAAVTPGQPCPKLSFVHIEARTINPFLFAQILDKGFPESADRVVEKKPSWRVSHCVVLIEILPHDRLCNLDSLTKTHHRLISFIAYCASLCALTTCFC